jgi:transcriptional regulator with XRE-family HTH domain
MQDDRTRTNIRTIRLSLGLTQEALAGRLGWDRRRVSLYETGRVHPHPRVVERLAKAMGASVEEVYGVGCT